MKRLVSNLLHKELSYQVQGAAIEVRKDFGPGHKEQLYQKALEEELKRRKIDFEREKAIKILSPNNLKPFYKKLGNINILVFISLILVSISGIKAEVTTPRLAVAPHTFELEVFPGQVRQEKIKLLNQGRTAIPMTARVTDFTAEEETGEMLYDESSQDPSFASRFWIKIENPNLLLESGATEALNFSIEVPENAEPGGHYATILFEPQLPPYEQGRTYLRTVPVIGVLFLFSVKVGGLERTAEPLTIVEFAIPENFHLKKLENLLANISGVFSKVFAKENEWFSITETGHLPFTLRIKNNDIYHIRPEGKMTIFRIPLIDTNIKPTDTNKILGETKISKTTILPQKTRKFLVEFKPELSGKLNKYFPAGIINFISQNLLWGKYKAVLNLKAEFKGKKMEEYREIEFLIFPWKIALTILFILTIFFLLRKRVKEAIKVILKPN